MTKGVLAILVDERIQTLEIVITIFFAGAHFPIQLVSVGATSEKRMWTAMLFQKVLEVRVVALLKGIPLTFPHDFDFKFVPCSFETVLFIKMIVIHVLHGASAQTRVRSFL